MGQGKGIPHITRRDTEHAKEQTRWVNLPLAREETIRASYEALDRGSRDSRLPHDLRVQNHHLAAALALVLQRIEGRRG